MFPGMAEVIKHSLIKDQAYYCWIRDHKESDLSKDPDTMLEMILVKL